MRSHFIRVLAMAAALACGGGLARAANSPPSVPAGATAPLAAHRALYTLKLANGRDGDIVAAQGQMGYEVTDACDAWIVHQRLRMTVTNSDGQAIEMSSDYATWESKDGLRFRFHVRQMTDTAVTSQTDGEAALKSPGGPGQAHFTSSRDDVKPLPAGTLFPMSHTAAVIAAAKAGKRFLSLPVFDGTDDNGVEDSSVVLLDWKSSVETKFAPLAPLPSARVRIAFFDRQPDTTTPNFSEGMRYWENGVADDLNMDFGEFVMNAKMNELTMLPRKC